MKKLPKRLLTGLLAVAMVFSLSGMTAFAAETDDSSGSAEDAVATIDADEEYPESDHPYANNEDASWDYTLEGAENGVYVTFDEQTEVERNYDYLYIYTGDGVLIGSYTGTTLAGATVYVPTASFTVRLTSDSSQTAWGFAVTNVEAVESAVDLNDYFTVSDPIAPTHVGEEPTVKLALGDYTLTQDVDYTVEADTSTVGVTVEVTIAGIEKYTGTLTTHVYVYDDEHLQEPASVASEMRSLRQSSDTGTSRVTLKDADAAYDASITEVTLRPVETDAPVADGGTVTGDTDTGELTYPNAPKEITLSADELTISGNNLTFNRTEEDPIVYVMEGHGYRYDNPSTRYPMCSYPQTQVYEVTVKATGYEDSVGLTTYYTGTNAAFSIIADYDDDKTTTDDQVILRTYTEDELREMASFANGSSQCGMTGFRTFTTNGVSLEDLLYDYNGDPIEVSPTDYFLLQTSDDYGNTFTYANLFGATRYFMSGIYDPAFKEVYDEAASDASSGGDTMIRRWLADYALQSGSTIQPRICIDYNESMIYQADIDAGVELPTADNTVFNSLVSFENQYRFVYGLQIAKEACTVSFDTNGGSDVESQTVLSHYMTSTENTTSRSSYWANSLIIYRNSEHADGKEHPDEAEGEDTITVPEDPTKDGYEFAGWYTDPDCTADSEFDFEANDGTVDENTTLYAKWVVMQSDHPYGNNEDQSWNYTLEGAENGVYVTFDEQTATEEGYDYIYIYDGDGNLIGQYDGTTLAGATVYVPTESFTVQLTSDSSYSEWGFAVTDVEAAELPFDLGRAGFVDDPLEPVLAGEEVSPTVTFGGAVLEKDADYKVEADTDTAGVWTDVTIEGINNYVGTLTTSVFVYDENAITVTDFDIASGEHDDADGELNQTIIATITFSDDIALASEDLSDDLDITIAGSSVYDTARTFTYEVQNGNQLVITMVSTGSVAITSGWLEISNPWQSGILAADGEGYVYMETQGGQIPTGIVVTNDMIEGTDAEPASTYVNVAHKANMRGMYFFQLLSIDEAGNETVLVSTNSHAHDFYGSIDEAAIASAIASACESKAEENAYTVDYEDGDTYFIITADNAVEGQKLAVRMVEIKAEINEAHAPVENIEYAGYEGMFTTRCSFCGAELYPQSDHNYSDNVDQFWTYTLDDAEYGVYVTFDEQTAMENGYDYIYIYDDENHLIGAYTGKELAGTTVYVPTPGFVIELESDPYENDWGFAVTDVEAAGETIDLSIYGVVEDPIEEVYVGLDPVADVFLNGGSYLLTPDVDYTISADTSVAGQTVEVTITGNGKYTGTLTTHVYVWDEGHMPYPESDHNYSNYADEWWTYTLEGATNGVYVTFDEQTNVESGYDYIYIYDGNGDLVGRYTGTALAGVTVYVPTDTFSINLTSDYTQVAWGFAVTNIEAAGEQLDLSKIGSVEDPLAPVYVGTEEITADVQANGVSLVQGTDFNVEADTSVAGQTVEVTITGIGDYCGTLITHVYVYDDEHLQEPASVASDMRVLRQSSDTGTSRVTLSGADDAYRAAITEVTLRPVETDAPVDEGGIVTGDTTTAETGGLVYPKAPKAITLSADELTISGNNLTFTRTEEEPIVYVTEEHGFPYIYDHDYYGQHYHEVYNQTQVYEVTVKATGYEDAVGLTTYYTGHSAGFSIIEDLDGDHLTTDDQHELASWTSDEIREMASFANGSSQCGMTGFRTFTTSGVSLTDLLEEAGVEVSANDRFLLQTSDDYGNEFSYASLFGTTRYFMSGIYDPAFVDVYNEAASDSSSGGNITIRRWLADYALEHGTTIDPRICIDYNETLIYGDDINAGVTLPTAENTTFNSLVSFENQYRFVYGIPIEQTACRVTFNSNGGSYVGQQTVLSHYMTSTSNTTMTSSYWGTSLIIYRDQGDGKEHPDEPEGADTITVPEDPTKDGYEFAGWYTDENCTAGNEFDFEANDGTVDENTTLYAKWVVMQSDHPYADNEDQAWDYTLEGATNGVYVTFDEQTETEENYDFIYIYDGDGNLIGQYTGTELAGATVYVPTDKFTVRLTSDSSYSEWGFAVTEVEAAGNTLELDKAGFVDDPLDPVLKNGNVSPTVTFGGVELEEGVDYTVDVDTGTAGRLAEVKITGNGRYSGTLTTHVFVYDETAITVTDFDIASGEHDDADGELNQTIIATITFSDDIALAYEDLSDDLDITIAGSSVYDTARTFTYEVQNGNQLVITMVSTGSVAITSGWLEISSIWQAGILAADGEGYVYMEPQGGQIPTGIVVTNDMIEGTDAEPASTYVNVAHKANMRGMYFYQLLSIDADGNETVLVSSNGHAHDFYNTVNEAAIASNIAAACSTAEGYTVEYTDDDTYFIITADNAKEGEKLAVRMVEIKAEINEAHAPTETILEDGMLITRCTFCGEVLEEEPAVYNDIPVYKDGEEVMTITGDAFEAAQAEAEVQTFTYTSGSGSHDVTAQFVLIKNLLGDVEPDEGCGFIATASDDFVSTFTEDYLDSAYLYYYYDEDYGACIYRTAVNGTMGRMWATDVVSFTMGHIFEDGVCTICGAEEPITYADIPVYKDGELVMTITGDAFEAAQAAAPEQTFTYTSGSGTNEVTAHFVKIKDLLGDVEPDEGCGFIATASDDFVSTFTEEYLETAYLYYEESSASYRTAVNGTMGRMWARDVVSFTMGHIFEDGVCTICGAEEPIITYADIPVYKDGEQVMTITGDAFAAAQAAAPEQTFTYTSGSGTNEVTAHFVLIKDLLGDVEPDEGCGFIATASDDFVSTFTEEYLETAYLYYEESSSSYRTAVNGTMGRMWARDVVSFTVGHIFEDGVCTICGAEEPIVVDKTELNATIAAAETLDESDYTPDSWAALQDVLAAAQAVAADDDATQEAVDDATAALEAAIDALQPAADKDELNFAIELAEALDESNYTEDSWAAMQEALAAAQEVAADPNATQDAVDEATNNLGTAIAGLVTPGPTDKTELTVAIAAAGLFDESDYTPDSWADLQEALAAAEAVAADPDATQEEVDAATSALEDAIDNLVPVTPDKADLEQEIEEAEALNEDDYTPESWIPFQEALDAAKAVLNDPDATPEDIEAAEEALKTAMDNLEPYKDGLIKDPDGVWRYYVNNEFAKDYTGFAENEFGDWYVERGVVAFDVTNILKDKDGHIGDAGTWYYVIDSKVQADFTGLSNFGNQYGWWYINNGKVDFTRNSVDKNCNGWWYVVGGKVQFGFNGLANYKNDYGWWYIQNGAVDFNHNGVDKNNNGWYYVTGGKVNFDFTGLANHRNDHGWWYVQSGKVNFNYTGLAKNQNGWFYVKDSKVDFSYSGIATNQYGTWYISDGRVAFTFSGTVTIDGKRYTVKGGKVS